MFTGPELSLFHDPYFSIIRLNDELCQLRSRNTGHCWMIWKNYNADPFRIELYHKHHLQDKYYHQQRRQVCSVRNAIRIIKEHDRYVLRCKKYKSRGLHRNRSEAAPE